MSEELWMSLVRAAHSLEEDVRDATPEAARERAFATVQTIVEIFPRTLDPFTEFEGYAVRQFAKALLAALSASEKPRG
jgi:hypothetical protein